MRHLPVEIWHHILSFNDPHWLWTHAAVCRHWYTIVRAYLEYKKRSLVRVVYVQHCVTSLRLIKCALAQTPTPTADICRFAAETGNVALMLFARSNKCPWSEATCMVAAQHNHTPVLQYAIANGCPYDVTMSIAAAKNGNLAFFQWLKNYKAKWLPLNADVFAAAVATNDLQFLMQMRSVFECPWDATTCRNIARIGNLDMLKWAFFNNCPIDRRTATAAAQHGNLSIVQWLYHRNKFGLIDRASICNAAAANGHLVMLQSLASHPFYYRPDQDAIVAAAQHGQIDTVAWLTTQNLKLDEDVFLAAARQGHVEMLKWLRKKRCKWSPLLCATVAGNGALDILKWLRTTKKWDGEMFGPCPWNDLTCDYAVRANRLEALKWAMRNGCSYSHELCSIAAAFGHLSILQWLRKFGCPWIWDTCVFAAIHGHLHVLEWAADNGGPITENVLHGAMCKGHKKIIDWYNKRYPLPSDI